MPRVRAIATVPTINFGFANGFSRDNKGDLVEDNSCIICLMWVARMVEGRFCASLSKYGSWGVDGLVW
jgi:hypothetical protein